MRKAIPTILALCLSAAAQAGSGYDGLVKLAGEWRQFEQPELHKCVPDYGAAAMARKAEGLQQFRSRLAGVHHENWPASQVNDVRLIDAEMKGLDFNLHILKQWARDPGFYATVFGEQSDVPAHEGSSAQPAIDLFRYAYPLSAADQKTLTCQIGAIPALLEQAKINLKDGNARDLWRFGSEVFKEQADVLAQLEAGTLKMRTLEGPVIGTLDDAGPELRKAVESARLATAAFAQWVEAQARHKTGPSGVGKENYTWYEQNVHLVPYGWDEQVTLLKRELDRAQAALRLEELHNRDLPQLQPVGDADAYAKLGTAKMQKITDFWIKSGLVPDRPYFRDAMMQQIGSYTPPEKRNFFDHTTALDPLGLYSHSYHWIELARLKNEPNQSPIRRLPILSNMFDSRSEGLATAMEEILLHAGLYDDEPRGKEIVWIMLANRAARGLASLYVQANEIDLDQAGRFHARWTPRGWSNPDSPLVRFEQLLYLRQPGYGTSYVTGKLGFDHLVTRAAHTAEMEGKPFDFAEFFQRFNQSGIVPFALIEDEMLPNAPNALKGPANALDMH
jgi:hypothetical protein